MSSKTGQRPTGKKRLTSNRTEAKTDGAFGKETMEQVKKGIDRNRDRGSAKLRKSA